jgi:hypothetical protein
MQSLLDRRCPVCNQPMALQRIIARQDYKREQHVLRCEPCAVTVMVPAEENRPVP